MPTLNEAISTAVRVQSTRTGVSLGDVATALGIGRTAFWHRLNNEKPWDTDDLEKLADSLHLHDGWELVELARQEASLSGMQDTGQKTPTTR